MITRWNQSDPDKWFTEKRVLDDLLVLWHLIGDAIPNAPPRWVGPRAAEYTEWVAFDVDLQNDEEDYQRRCESVYDAIGRLGIGRETCLITRTPSGGQHIRFFLTEPVRVDAVAAAMERIGLTFIKGQIERFPSPTAGLRLPFGLIPGKAHDPTEWVRFIRKWTHGEIQRFDWEGLDARLRTFERSPNGAPNAALDGQPMRGLGELSAAELNSLIPSLLGTAPSSLNDQRDSSGSQISDQKYRELLKAPHSDWRSTEELLQFGIRAPGTRVTATHKLAHYLLRCKHLSCKVAEDKLVEWVYKSGATHSKDVKSDLANGTRHVEKQTRSLVQWYYKRRKPPQSDNERRFTAREVEAFVKLLQSASLPLSAECIECALRILDFAKWCGLPCDGGVESQIAMSVINKWPCCRESAPSIWINWLRKATVIKITREAVPSDDGTGQARTYYIGVTPDCEWPETIAFSQALANVCSMLGVSS